jgi:hypothetical protein
MTPTHDSTDTRITLYINLAIKLGEIHNTHVKVEVHTNIITNPYNTALHTLD